jgi:hypothetical protein
MTESLNLADLDPFSPGLVPELEDLSPWRDLDRDFPEALLLV